MPLRILSLFEQDLEEDFQETDFLLADYLIGIRSGVFVVNCLAVHPLAVLELLVLVKPQALTCSVPHEVYVVLTIH